MATYYFDASLGSNTSGDGSIGNPWKYYDGKQASVSAGDTVLFKRGTYQIIDSLYLFFRSGTAATPTYYGVYGTGISKVTWFCTNTWGHLFNGSNTSYVTIEDFNFDCSNQSSGSIYWSAQGSGSTSNIILRRCDFYGSTTGTGLAFSKELSATTGSISNCLIEYCNSYNNGAHGFGVVGGKNITFRGCRAWNNGARNVTGGHGFTARALRQSYTSGWTLVSSTIYSRPLAVNEYDVYYAQTSGTYSRLYKNTSTPTTPGLGEFGVSGGLLYINIGATPEGTTVGYAYENCTGILWEYCEAFANIWNPIAPFHEGHGIALDDYTQNSIVRKCYVHDNEGLGLSNNRGDGNLYEANLVINNWQSGFTANPASNVIIKNNTFINNNRGTGAHNGEIRFSTKYQQNHIVINNHVEARNSGNIYGIDADPLSTNITAIRNNIFNCSTPVRTAVETGTLNVDALLDMFFSPTTTSPLIAAGTYVNASQDKNGVVYQNPPTIGAYEYIRPRTAATTRTMRT